MKVKRDENSVTLVPETIYEADCLKMIQENAIYRKQFEDAWEGTGGLVIQFRDVDEYWGR